MRPWLLVLHCLACCQAFAVPPGLSNKGVFAQQQQQQQQQQRRLRPSHVSLSEDGRSAEVASMDGASAEAGSTGRTQCPKFIVVTGGVLSGIGKGVTASSIGVLCKMMGMKPTAIKIDPYLNVDAGTMSPFEHGEVFVLDDGGETDLDLGNYERFMGVSLKKESNLTTGKIYKDVIEKERRGDYLGKTVQVVPHVTDALQEWILSVSTRPVSELDEDGQEGLEAKPDVCIIELGGTLGDMESMPFVEALRQLQTRVGYKNVMFCHVSLVPHIGSPGEQKTKPTQHSVKQMRELGLTPDFIMCRGSQPMTSPVTEKLSMFCQVPQECVISVHDVSNMYRVPLLLLEQGFCEQMQSRLRLKNRHRSEAASAPVHLDPGLLKDWEALAASYDNVADETRIALVGKYTDLHDTYHSVSKALLHAALATKRKLEVEWIDSSELDLASASSPQVLEETWERLRACHGVLVPGGFGERGLEGMIAAVNYARSEKVPFLGICLGMQCAVIEYSRSRLGMDQATSAEFSQEASAHNHVVVFMPEGSRTHMGGTMRLGSRATVVQPGSICHALYGGLEAPLEIHERHRHRYEVNPKVVEKLEREGLMFVGKNTDKTGERMEVVELPTADHPFFVGVQFHPEFKSRPGKPSPLFKGFMTSASQHAPATQPPRI